MLKQSFGKESFSLGQNGLPSALRSAGKLDTTCLVYLHRKNNSLRRINGKSWIYKMEIRCYFTVSCLYYCLYSTCMS